MDPLHIILAVALAICVGVILWLLRERSRLHMENELAKARLGDREEMRVGFQSVASEVLRNSSTDFLNLAKESLASSSTTALGEMEKRRVALDELVSPLRRALEETHKQLQRTQKDSAGLREQVDHVAHTNLTLRAETSKLAQALRKPNVRGRYGEVQLERVVELAGMRNYCDFTPQASLRDSEGRLQKPDVIVKLPNGRVVAIDAKTPLDAYMDALDTNDPEEQNRRLDRYAKNFVEQMRKLADKQYWANFEDSPELVVMFVPGDQLVDAALERSPDLIDLAANRNIVIASPSTLIGLLRAVHVGWRERNLTDNAEELFRLGRELHQRAATVIDHAGRLGDSLDSARKNYNKFARSVRTRLVPTLRKFEEHKAYSPKAIVEPKTIDEEIQPIDPAELPSASSLVEPHGPAEAPKDASSTGAV